MRKSEKYKLWRNIISAVAPILLAGIGLWKADIPKIHLNGDNYGNIAAINAGGDVTISQSTSPPEHELTGLLLPSNTPIPAQYIWKPRNNNWTDYDFESRHKNAFRVYLGRNICVLSEKREIIALRVQNQDLIKMRLTPEGVSLSATVYREDGRVVAQIENNRYSINPNNYFMSPVRIDKSTISVRDKTGTEVLRASFLNERAFELLGIFEVPGSPALHVTRDSITLGNKSFITRSNLSVDPPEVCFTFSSDSNSETRLAM